MPGNTATKPPVHADANRPSPSTEQNRTKQNLEKLCLGEIFQQDSHTSPMKPPSLALRQANPDNSSRKPFDGPFVPGCGSSYPWKLCRTTTGREHGAQCVSRDGVFGSQATLGEDAPHATLARHTVSVKHAAKIHGKARDPPSSQKRAKNEPKWSQKGAKKEPKGARKEPKKSQKAENSRKEPPKRANQEPKRSQPPKNAGRCAGKSGGQNGPPSQSGPPARVAGAQDARTSKAEIGNWFGLAAG